MGKKDEKGEQKYTVSWPKGVSHHELHTCITATKTDEGVFKTNVDVFKTKFPYWFSKELVNFICSFCIIYDFHENLAMKYSFHTQHSHSLYSN